jgi:hypothetical protein
MAKMLPCKMISLPTITAGSYNHRGHIRGGSGANGQTTKTVWLRSATRVGCDGKNDGSGCDREKDWSNTQGHYDHGQPVGDLNQGATPMKDYQTSLEKLRKDAAENRLISDLATDKAKRETFAKLADHLNALADEVERAMAAKEIEEDR